MKSNTYLHIAKNPISHVLGQIENTHIVCDRLANEQLSTKKKLLHERLSFGTSYARPFNKLDIQWNIEC